jgi:hypothetical protein
MQRRHVRRSCGDHVCRRLTVPLDSPSLVRAMRFGDEHVQRRDLGSIRSASASGRAARWCRRTATHVLADVGRVRVDEDLAVLVAVDRMTAGGSPAPRRRAVAR